MYEKINKFPLLCAPITGNSHANIMAQTKEICRQSPDVLEWRADFFNKLHQTDEVLATLQAIRKETTTPIMFTIRAEHEGGEAITLSEKEKIDLMVTVCESADIQYIDLEIKTEYAFVEAVRTASKARGIAFIMSYHHFSETPEKPVIDELANQAVANKADFVKFALMPQSKDDVYRLLWMTKELKKHLTIPVITMSMGELGALSRIIGWTYGSVLTFGVGVKASAPGQISLTALQEAIEKTKEALDTSVL